MKCAACHNEMVKKKGEIDLRIKGKLYIVKSAFFEECPACGERVITPKVFEDLSEKINNNKFIEETLKIPVLESTYG